MTEQDHIAEELPPFSFTKKPIRNVLPTSSIPADLAKTISDTQPALEPTLNNINYDEQIRAPRMSLTNHYTYQPELPRPFTDRLDSGASRAVSSGTLANLHPDAFGAALSSPPPQHRANNDSEAYQPATVDLSQTTRRQLEPIQVQWGTEEHKLLNFGSAEHSDEELGVGYSELDDTTLLMRLKLQRAVDNLNSNTTTAERREDRFKTEHKPIKQVYKLKKPLCVPAVLRPQAGEDYINEEDFLHELTPEEHFALLKMAEYSFEVPLPSLNDEVQAEPTHAHWRPDNSSDHCVNCFEVFGGFFYPQRRRRHHCRFCGFLFCVNCLYRQRESPTFEESPSKGRQLSTRANSSSSNASSIVLNLSTMSSGTSYLSGVMLDSKARFVVPMFKNMAGQDSTMAALQEKFKVCKVCKVCGNNFLRLMYLLNQRSRQKDDIAALYVFIENPYTANHYLSQPLHDIKALMSRQDGDMRASVERRQSLGPVATDWIWSSF